MNRIGLFSKNKFCRFLSARTQRQLYVGSLSKEKFEWFPTNTAAMFSGNGSIENEQQILLQCANNIATLTFNREKKANAIGIQMLTELRECICFLSGKEGNNIRCVVLKSSNDKVFSAGADLKERSVMNKVEAKEFVTSLRDCLDSLSSLPMPLIASVEGAALGGGLEIALCSDIVVAGNNARFGAPETALAIIPGAGGTQRLPRRIGTARAKELIFTARKIGAKTACDFGIVQYVTEKGGADEKAMALAAEMAKNGPIALRAAKVSIDKGMECASLSDAMQIEKSCYQQVLETEDRLEGLAAFKEKRIPNYQGC
jgi:methylglutaconyl-CoA hydratase